MLARKQRWLLAGLVTTLALTGGALKLWQRWQHSHFDCRGDIEVFAPDSRANITLRYIFDGDKGVALLTGMMTRGNAEPVEINHRVWFTFTHNGNDFFLNSENITSNEGGDIVPSGLAPILPTFYLQAGEPFYLDIIRIDGNNRLFSTSRVPSLLCKS